MPALPSEVSALCAGGINIHPDSRYRRPASFVDAGASCALVTSGDVYCWGEPALSFTPILATRRK